MRFREIQMNIGMAIQKISSRNILRKGARCAVFLCLCAALSGCKGYTSRQADYRRQGIEQLGAGNYAEAVQSFDLALFEKKGRVNSFHVDVLKYRAEAEYKAEDYESARNTYTILLEVDGRKVEYLVPYTLSCLQSEAWQDALDSYQELADIEKAREHAGQVLAVFAERIEKKASGMPLEPDQSEAPGEAELRRVHPQVDALVAEAIAGWDQEDITDLGTLYGIQGIHYVGTREYDLALERFEAGIFACSGKPNGMKAAQTCYYNQAVTYEYTGDFQKARELLETYMAHYGSNPELERELIFLRTR